MVGLEKGIEPEVSPKQVDENLEKQENIN